MSEYKLFNGNCLDIIKSFPDNCIDLIATDPPYHMERILGGGSVNKAGKMKSLKELEKNNLIYGYDIELYCKEFIRVMKDINIYFWCNKKQIFDYLKLFIEKHKCTFNILFWGKTNPIPTYSNKYMADCEEYLLHFRKGKAKCLPQTYADARTYYVSPLNLKDKLKYKHPTVKPLDFTRRIIRNSSRENQVILDPFMGSGTSIVAALLEGRNAIGIEINKEYFNIAQKRIENEIKDL